MPAAKYDLYIEQGAAYWMPFQYKDGNGNPYNLTGYSFRGQIRPTADSATVLLDMTTSNYIVNTNPATGYFELSITANITATLPPGQWVYDLEAYQTAGPDVKRLVKGNVTVDAEVTR